MSPPESAGADPGPARNEPSWARIRSQKANAQKSTGARTPEGKARSSLNNLMHGGRSQSRETLPGEDPRELEALKQDCIRDLNACTTTERFLAENVALCQWRLRRAGRAEAAALALQLHALD